MKNSVCFSCFSNSAKPNRLIFQEKFPEGQKSLPKESTDSKEEVQENNTLAYQRVLALENLRRRLFEISTSFIGSDSTKTEKAQNEVFQYLFEKLNGFFKAQTSTEWPINRQREWMDAAVDLIINNLSHSVGGTGSISSKEDVDYIVPFFILDDLGRRGVYPGVGPFPVWFSKRYPVEYKKIFRKDVEKN